MSTQLEDPPFERGKTFYAGRTIDTSALEGVQYEGKEYEFNDEDPSAATVRSNRKVRVRVVRNWTNATLAVKAIVTGSTQGLTGTTTDYYKSRVKLAGSLDRPEGAVDEYLPAAAAIGDLFYIVVNGPATVTTPATGQSIAIATGDTLVTAASGRVTEVDYLATATSLISTMEARIGVALEQTTSTSDDIVADIQLGH